MLIRGWVQMKLYVHTVTSSCGEHEIHVEGCQRMLGPEYRAYFGDFNTYKAAITKAHSMGLHFSECHQCAITCSSHSDGRTALA